MEESTEKEMDIYFLKNSIHWTLEKEEKEKFEKMNYRYKMILKKIDDKVFLYEIEGKV